MNRRGFLAALGGGVLAGALLKATGKQSRVQYYTGQAIRHPRASMIPERWTATTYQYRPYISQTLQKKG